MFIKLILSEKCLKKDKLNAICKGNGRVVLNPKKTVMSIEIKLCGFIAAECE